MYCGIFLLFLGSNGSNQVPAKVLWYFPPIPRFKRTKDGKLCRPADSPAWHLVDSNTKSHNETLKLTLKL